MLTELSVGLEAAGVPLPAIEDLTDINTVAELSRVVKSARGKPIELERREALPSEETEEGEKDIEVPDPVARAGRKLLGLGQRVLYESLFDVRLHGKNYIPKNRNYLVIANHTSHLDMGLVKMALAEEGERLVTLAARDYFFDTPAKRAYFENFTNLIPMDRKGSLRESLALAGEALDQGYHLLIFPEGTRSKSGELLEFKPTLGYLALQHDVDVLPMYIEGAFEALPKGAFLPRAKDLTVRIGPSLRIDAYRDRVAGLAKSEAYRVITRAAEEAVRALAQGKVLHGISPPRPVKAERVEKKHLNGNGHQTNGWVKHAAEKAEKKDEKPHKPKRKASKETP